jgi:hypothetical protein
MVARRRIRANAGGRSVKTADKPVKEPQDLGAGLGELSSGDAVEATVQRHCKAEKTKENIVAPAAA